MELPPFAGIVTAAEAQRPGLPVRDATAILHRLAYMKQRLAIAAAVFLPSTPEWEAKCALALHQWQSAEHVDAMGRVFGISRDEAMALRTFDHYCTCGGFAWPLSGRDPARPHMDWCPQRQQYNEWWDALHGESEAHASPQETR